MQESKQTQNKNTEEKARTGMVPSISQISPSKKTDRAVLNAHLGLRGEQAGAGPSDHLPLCASTRRPQANSAT